MYYSIMRVWVRPLTFGREVVDPRNPPLPPGSVSIVDDWLTALEDGNEICVEDGNKICVVFFDAQKTFDSVPHAPLSSRNWPILANGNGSKGT